MIYIFVAKDEFTKEMEKVDASINTIADYKVIRFSDIVSIPQEFNLYRRFNSNDYKDIVVAINNGGLVLNKRESDPQQTFAIANNRTKDGKFLYAQVKGVKAQVPAGQSHVFEYQVEYPEIYFFGAEIMQDIIGVADFTINHPQLPDPLEQYGDNVNLGTIKYIRETRFAARIPQGLILRCNYTNDTDVEQEVGVNFLMHEIRDPNE